MAEKLINTVNLIRTDKRRSINIFGDKGYISKDIYTKCKKIKINYVYHQRINVKKPIIYNTKLIKILNTKRCIVEHLIYKLDSFKRIAVRFEKKIENFKSFNIMAFSRLLYKFL